jgi:23S rRNA pseudoU1915 N3-methylase RlmH
VIILGDSHLRDGAVEINQFLNTTFAVSSLIKPGAGIDNIINSLEAECNVMGKKDVVVISAGANDIYNNINKGNEITQKMTKFWQSHSNTNIVTVEIPHRHDYEKDSQLNRAIRELNKGFLDEAKRFNHVALIQIEQDRSNYNKYGLHLNWKGKDRLARQVAQQITKHVKTGQKVKAMEKERPQTKSVELEITEKVTPEPNSSTIVEGNREIRKDFTVQQGEDSNRISREENNSCIGFDRPNQLGQDSTSQEAVSENDNTGTNLREQLETGQSTDRREEESDVTVTRCSTRQKKPSKNRYSDFLWE